MITIAIFTDPAIIPIHSFVEIPGSEWKYKVPAAACGYSSLLKENTTKVHLLKGFWH